MSVVPVTAPRNESRTAVQIARFLVIGGISVLIDLIAYRALDAIGVDRHLGKGLSYLAGMLFGFSETNFWTFESQRNTIAEPTIYLLLYVTTLGINIGVNAFALGLIGRDQTSLAFFIATGVTTVLNFLGIKFLAFRSAS